MANNGPTFTRLGPGDLPGDPNHPNSPDYVEPEYGLDDAGADVAAKLVKEGEVGELVDTLAESSSLTQWLIRNVELPAWHQATLDRLDLLCERMDKERDAAYVNMNAKQEREDA